MQVAQVKKITAKNYTYRDPQPQVVEHFVIYY